jgi:hypothetical protein
MRLTFVPLFLLSVCLFTTTNSFARVPTRPSSENGFDLNAAFWNLFAPSGPATLTVNGKKVTYTKQVVCTNQQVTNAFNPSDAANSGACEDGQYTFLYQFQSTSANVKIIFGRLVGFTPDVNAPSYGAALCDSKGSTNPNTLQLCTTATEPQLPNITFTSVNKTTINFVVPDFPVFPAGTGNQGKGLTLVFTTTQTKPVPVAFPSVSIQ